MVIGSLIEYSPDHIVGTVWNAFWKARGFVLSTDIMGRSAEIMWVPSIEFGGRMVTYSAMPIRDLNILSYGDKNESI
jgi:hypothetical protein